ncbi:MAG: hypothetical protein ACREMS_04875 [Gemmatimonadaceae bacterium]
MRKKYCNFCGEPLQDADKECKQCGWDRSQDGPPSSDPADNKARAGVAAGLVVAYAVMWFLIQGTPDVARATTVSTPFYSTSDSPAETPTEPDAPPVMGQPISVGVVPTNAQPALPTMGPTAKLLVIKVSDNKAAHIEAHDALDYDFVLPETDQKCRLVGDVHGIGGFDRDLEIFLLTDDEYLFWHANPAAIPHSSWETIRGSETPLGYDLPAAGTYHLVISNEMSPTSKVVQVKAQVKCAR